MQEEKKWRRRGTPRPLHRDDAERETGNQIRLHVYGYTCLYMYIYISVYMCMSAIGVIRLHRHHEDAGHSERLHASVMNIVLYGVCVHQEGPARDEGHWPSSKREDIRVPFLSPEHTGIAVSAFGLYFKLDTCNEKYPSAQREEPVSVYACNTLCLGQASKCRCSARDTYACESLLVSIHGPRSMYTCVREDHVRGGVPQVEFADRPTSQDGR